MQKSPYCIQLASHSVKIELTEEHILSCQEIETVCRTTEIDLA
jgi:hypothetical protein